MSVPFNDLKRRYLALKPLLDEAILRVLNSGWYILGPEVEAFENEFAAYCQSSCCVGVANGTDALEIALRSAGITAGDDVITVANAGMYSTTAIRSTGARPVFTDIDPHTYTMDPASLAAQITRRTQAVIVTHLYGRMANMEELLRVTQAHNLLLIEDCAQAHGAAWQGRKAGSWGDLSCFSFYPTKNLGALGDGGAIVTSDRQFAERARYLRQYGWTQKYNAQLTGGRNSRLDELQAATLRAQLPHLDTWNQRRREIAAQYQHGLQSAELQLPSPGIGDEMIFHLYVISNLQRDVLRAALRRREIGCDVHYPVPDHLQVANQDLGYSSGTLPKSEQAALKVLSLPCFAEMSTQEVDEVILAVQSSLNELHG